MERWKCIVLFPDYEVSTLGRVRRRKPTKRGSYLGRILKAFPGFDGYIAVGLYKDGRRVRYKVHQLVTRTFIGKRPNGYHTRHLDGNKFNNCLSNLKYGTPSQNAFDKLRYGAQLGAPKGNRNAAKLDLRDYPLIKRLLRLGAFQSTVGDMFGVSQSCIRDVSKRTSLARR